ncbi:MAG: hypothetical protein ACSHXF_07560 [Aquaticitalea sp.]
MKKVFVTLLVCFSLNFGFAQKFITEKSASFQKESEKDIYHILFPSAYGFMTLHHLDNVMMDNTKAMVLTKYDQSMQAIDTKSFNLPKLGQRASDLVRTIEVGDHLVVLSSVMDKQSAAHQFNGQIYNQKDNSVSDNKVLASFTIDGYGKSGFYQVAVSPDQSKIAILANMPFEKKTQEQVKIWVYDTALNLIWEQSETLNYESDRAYQEDLFVLNSGEVVMNKITDAFKKSRVSELLTFNGKTVETVAFSSAGFQPMNMELINVNGAPMFAGFFWNGKSSVISINNAEGDDNDGAFLYDFNAKNLIGIHEWSNTLDAQNLKSLAVVDVQVVNDDIIFIGERQLTKSEFRKSGNTTTMDLDYTYTFGSSVIVTMDHKGTLKSYIPLFHSRTFINEDKELGSFAALQLENALRIFSNNDGHITHNEYFTTTKAGFYAPEIRVSDSNNYTKPPKLVPATMRMVPNYAMVYYITNYNDRYWLNKMTW